MLKIKDNIDLKELEKFGFDFIERNNEYRFFGTEQIIVMCKNRHIYVEDTGSFGIVEDEPLDILFNLIQAGFVEKEGEE